MIVAPIPYIGQNGPLRKPVLISFLSHIERNTDSITHPKNEYKMK